MFRIIDQLKKQRMWCLKKKRQPYNYNRDRIISKYVKRINLLIGLPPIFFG